MRPGTSSAPQNIGNTKEKRQTLIGDRTIRGNFQETRIRVLKVNNKIRRRPMDLRKSKIAAGGSLAPIGKNTQGGNNYVQAKQRHNKKQGNKKKHTNIKDKPQAKHQKKKKGNTQPKTV